MGHYKQIATNETHTQKYSSKIGVIVTLINELDYEIQVFIEAILNLSHANNTSLPIRLLIRSFDISKRIIFLKSLIKAKHPTNFDDYLKVHDEIIKCSEIRNNLAHSQIYFYDDPSGVHMMVTNMKTALSKTSDDWYIELSYNQLDDYIKRIHKLIKKTESFTYKLGYFQGHDVK